MLNKDLKALLPASSGSLQEVQEDSSMWKLLAELSPCRTQLCPQNSSLTAGELCCCLQLGLLFDQHASQNGETEQPLPSPRFFLRDAIQQSSVPSLSTASSLRQWENILFSQEKKRLRNKQSLTKNFKVWILKSLKIYKCCVSSKEGS